MNQASTDKKTWKETILSATLSPWHFVSFLICYLLTLSCSSIDCPLNSRVATVYKLAGDVVPLLDSLTISTTRANGTDSILLNRAVGIDSFILPISYNHPQDILFFRRSNSTGWSATDTVVVEKQDLPHFEAVDCNPSYFHIITRVSHTHLGIDSIVVNKAKVTYDATQPHLLVYFKILYQ